MQLNRTTRDYLADVHRHPQLSLVLLSLVLRLSTSLLLISSSRFLPSFRTDATPLALPISPWFDGFVRWDAVHFVHIAVGGLGGYGEEERTAAFMPGLPVGVMRGGGEALRWVLGREKLEADGVVLAGIVGTTLATTGAAILLYRCVLSFHSHP
jgi:phosphatidylinositol glycan class V